MPLIAAMLSSCASNPPADEPPVYAPPPAVVTQTADLDEPATVPRGKVTLRDNAPLSYVVKKGDTLWDISNHFLLDAWQWPEIWYVNGQVRNPHLIYPGDVLKLITVDGRPQITLDLERMSPRIRASALDEAIPTIPLDAIRHFLRGPRFVTEDQLKFAPYLLAFVDEHIIGAQGNLIYVRQLKPSESDRYAVVRKGRVYTDPDDGKTLGYEAIPVGEAEIRKFGDPSTAMLSLSDREALIGDRLLPVEPEAFDPNFYPHSPAGPVGGRIISVFDGVSQIGQYAIVAINRGSDHGLEAGHVLHIMQAGSKVKDPYASGRVQLPDQYAGKLMVFKTTPRVSYGLVMSVVRAAHELDKVERPEPSR